MTIFRSTHLHRRLFLKFLGGSLPAAVALHTPLASAAGKTVRIVEFNPAGARTGVAEVEKVEKPNGEWKKQLTAEQFAVARQADRIQRQRAAVFAVG